MFRLFLKLLTLFGFGLLGNWAGEQLRFIVTGERSHELTVVRTTPDGETVIAANPLFSNLLPAFGFSLLGKPHWWYAFVGGAAASFILGDQYEDRFLEFIEGVANPDEQL